MEQKINIRRKGKEIEVNNLDDLLEGDVVRLSSNSSKHSSYIYILYEGKKNGNRVFLRRYEDELISRKTLHDDILSIEKGHLSIKISDEEALKAYKKGKYSLDVYLKFSTSDEKDYNELDNKLNEVNL